MFPARAALGTRFAALYASNTAGAIAPTLLVGFVLIGRVGIGASFGIAAAANAFLAVGAFALDRRHRAPAEGESTHWPRTADVALTGEDKLLLAAFTASGFAALAHVRLTSFDVLLAAYAAGPDEMRAFVGNTPVLPDDHPRIEYFGSLPEKEPALDFGQLRGDVRRHLAH